ncbi:MAG: hypothetical protein K9I70_08005 [Chitinophagaceae bacterium]|nr:hypothetical protein [Chitinophagaceae bacterium]
MATQFLVTLAVTIFIGYKVDHLLSLSFPIFTTSLPLLILFVTFWKIYKDTSK